MKILIKMSVLFIAIICFLNVQVKAQKCYSDDYVEISSVKSRSDTYDIVTMKRSGKRVKAKYFAANDYNGNSVYQRYLNWKKSNPNVILLSSGTYMDNNDEPVGLTIDNGIMVNETLIYDMMDALVIIYATGGIAVSNLEDGNLKLSGSNKLLDIRNSLNDLHYFKQWAKENDATVFQTHLLVFDDELKIDRRTSSSSSRERRFLAVGQNEYGEIVHTIVYNPEYTSLYNGSKKVKEFLNDFKEIEVIFMINLDTGKQDVFQLYNSDCSKNRSMQGRVNPPYAINLLAYYFN